MQGRVLRKPNKALVQAARSQEESSLYKERRIHNLQVTNNKTRLFCVCVVVWCMREGLLLIRSSAISTLGVMG